MLTLAQFSEAQFREESGETRWIRTIDPLIKSEMLYRLSYGLVNFWILRDTRELWSPQQLITVFLGRYLPNGSPKSRVSSRPGPVLSRITGTFRKSSINLIKPCSSSGSWPTLVMPLVS